MISWLILSHVGYDVIKKNLEIKEKGRKMGSHLFGLRKERRKLPLLSHTINAPKQGEKSKEKGENEEKVGRKSKMMRREMRKRKGRERKAKRKEAKRKEAKRVGEEWRMQWLDVLHFRESVLLLSRFVADPTVGFFRDKKDSCSTRRGQRVGTGFGEFRQTP